jgi:hypothetical protein
MYKTEESVRACGNSAILIFSPLKAEGDGRATTG